MALKYKFEVFKIKDYINKMINSDNIIHKVSEQGYAIIFDQRGIHGGTKSKVNDRLIVRMAYNRITQN